MHDVYRGKDCMKKFCEYLREQAMEIINHKKNKKNSAIFVENNLKINMLNIKNIVHLKYTVTKEICIVFHNGSNYDYRFIMKDLADNLLAQEKILKNAFQKTFSVPIEKEFKRIDKKEKEITKTITVF